MYVFLPARLAPLRYMYDYMLTKETGRDAMSEIWYSGEVSGTIIVQCVPVLRPFVKDLKSSLASRRLEATEPSKGSNWRGSTLVDNKKGFVPVVDEEKNPMSWELRQIPEEPGQPAPRMFGHQAEAYFSASEVDLNRSSQPKAAAARRANNSESWPL